MKTLILATLAAPLALAAMPATAATTIFNATFENVPGGPTGNGQFTTVSSAEGFSSTNGIELQQRVAGDPAPTGGNVFVELDTTGVNSSMFRTIATGGRFDLSYLYSPRPGVGAGSNGIEVRVNGVLIAPGLVTADGGGNTSWSTINTGFTAAAGSVLSFNAVTASDGVGGYIDNINLTAVPEPASWALMIGGLGMVGGTMRRRRSLALPALA